MSKLTAYTLHARIMTLHVCTLPLAVIVSWQAGGSISKYGPIAIVHFDPARDLLVNARLVAQPFPLHAAAPV